MIPACEANVYQLETPGGFAEWLACDGRRGAIQKAHQRRRASEAAQAAAYANALATAEEVSKDKAGVQAGKGKGKEAKEEETEKSNEWTEEEDKQLMDWKNENPNGQWSIISKELGKSDNACRNRFKDIKPKDWKPNVAKENDNKDGKATQKQGNTKKKQNEQKKEDSSAAPANSWDTPTGGDGGGGENSGWGGDEFAGIFDESNDNQKTGSDKTKNDSTGNADLWGSGVNGASWEMNDNEQKATGDSGDTGTAAWDTAGNDAWNAKGNEEKTNEGNTWGTGGDWQNPSGDGQNDTKANEWGGITTEDKKDNNASAAWDTPAQEPPATKADSVKGSKHGASKSHSSHRRRSHSKKTSAEESHVIELKPDDTFSTGDLQLIARILQKDAADIWQRVSWRFGDKTGRYNIDPDVFEKKITGHVEGKESSKGSRKRK